MLYPNRSRLGGAGTHHRRNKHVNKHKVGVSVKGGIPQNEGLKTLNQGNNGHVNSWIKNINTVQ